MSKTAEATATEEVAPEPEAPALDPYTLNLINFMSKNDGKVYTDTLVLGDYHASDGNLTFSGTKKRPITLEDGRTIEKIPRYYIQTFYMRVEKYASVFKNFNPASLPYERLNDFDEHKGKVYEIEYIKRNWVENYVDGTKPIEGKFLTKMTLIE